MNATYLFDEEGKKIAVRVPIDEWNLYEEDLKKIRKRKEVLQGIKEAVLEVRTARKRGRKLQTFDDFINEL